MLKCCSQYSSPKCSRLKFDSAAFARLRTFEKLAQSNSL